MTWAQWAQYDTKFQYAI